MTIPKMRPCPSCGNPYVALYGYEWGWQHVECDECYYLGPGEGSMLQAVRSHNALASGSRRAKTPKAVECEASQSGDAKQRNAQPQSRTNS